MRRRTKSEDAEVGTSAMIIFIAIVLASSIISSILIGVSGNVFSKSKADAQQNYPSLNGIVNVVILEIHSLGTDDELHLVFELPYVENPVPDEDVSWILLCVPPNQGGHTTVQFDEGDFSTATTLDGDGLTALPLVDFEPGVNYRMIIQLETCNLEEIDEAKLVVIVDRGRTLEKRLDIGTSPYEGKDLNCGD